MPQAYVYLDLPAATPATFRVRVENLRLPANVPAGMNPLVLLSLAYRLRSSTEDVEPITVRATSDNVFQVVDGRHRFVAHVIAGRSEVLCRVAPD